MGRAFLALAFISEALEVVNVILLSMKGVILVRGWVGECFLPYTVMNIEWDYSYYQPWSDNEWLVDKMIAMREETLMVQNKNITMQ